MEHNGADQEQFEDADKWHHIMITWQHFTVTQKHTKDILLVNIKGRLICDALLFASNILDSIPKG